jgi:hypothetical protein
MSSFFDQQPEGILKPDFLLRFSGFLWLSTMPLGSIVPEGGLISLLRVTLYKP